MGLIVDSIMRACFKQMSSDNISVILVCFNNFNKLHSEEKLDQIAKKLKKMKNESIVSYVFKGKVSEYEKEYEQINSANKIAINEYLASVKNIGAKPQEAKETETIEIKDKSQNKFRNSPKVVDHNKDKIKDSLVKEKTEEIKVSTSKVSKITINKKVPPNIKNIINNTSSTKVVMP